MARLFFGMIVNLGDYLITNGQPNELDYKMLEDLGFTIDTNIPELV